jgi:hypothetical protein
MPGTKKLFRAKALVGKVRALAEKERLSPDLVRLLETASLRPALHRQRGLSHPAGCRFVFPFPFRHEKTSAFRSARAG